MYAYEYNFTAYSLYGQPLKKAIPITTECAVPLCLHFGSAVFRGQI